MSKLNRRDETETKVDQLLAKMTLEEKIAQLQACWIYELQTTGVMDESKIKARLHSGIGQITRIGGASIYTPPQAAKIYNQIQRFLLKETRLGIPAINHEECCAGLMTAGGSIFPQIIGLASTFQPELAKEMTTAIRRQMLAVGARQGLAPVLDIARDPRWGRVEETFGEDPTLVSQFGMAYIQGLQGEDLRQGVMATAKHFVGHSFSQGGLNCGPVHLGWRELWEVYLAPFEAAIRDAGLASMMNAYPELDGEVVAASRQILTDLLRDQLGFTGLVVSDYEAVMMIHNFHRMVKTRKEAAIRALSAGIDVELPTTVCYGDDLLDAFKSREIAIELVDKAVKRHLQKKFELGLFENPYVDEEQVLEVFDTKQNRDLAYEIACKSMVLLKNDGLLPLKPLALKLAVIGPNADSSRCLMGDYSYAAVTELMKFNPETSASFGSLTDKELRERTVNVPSFLEAIKERIPASQLSYAAGCDIKSDDEQNFSDAVKIAEQSDVCIMVMGGLSGLVPQCTTGEFRDTTDLGLPGVQEKLVKTILATGKPVVLVLLNGRPVAIPDLVKPIHAILEAWVPGEEGSRAIVDILLGDINPSGKLPLSFARSVGQVPIFYNHKPSGMRSHIYGDYMNEEVTPLFPFGHGLSYTKFEYTDLILSQKVVKTNETVDISLSLKNVGEVSGDEVVQLYVCDAYASMPRPVKELKGFIRVSLQPGQVKKIVFHLPINQMAYYDHDLKLILEPGNFKVMLGSSSSDIRLQDELTLPGDTVIEIKDRVFLCPVEIIS